LDIVPDDHDPQSDGNYIEIRLDFAEPNGDEQPALAQVQVHTHHVPDGMFIDALLALAKEQVKKAMVTNMFKDSVPDQVRAFAANIMVNKYLTDRINSGEIGIAEQIDFKVPDDARELFEEGS
jgi:hypothetical protein